MRRDLDVSHYESEQTAPKDIGKDLLEDDSDDDARNAVSETEFYGNDEAAVGEAERKSLVMTAKSLQYASGRQQLGVRLGKHKSMKAVVLLHPGPKPAESDGIICARGKQPQ